MPVVWRGTDAVIILKFDAEAAAVEHRQSVVSRAQYLAWGPGLAIAIGRCVDQHEQSLRAVQRALGSTILSTQIDSGFVRDIAVPEDGAEFAGIV